jgi:hypothetical protein
MCERVRNTKPSFYHLKLLYCMKKLCLFASMLFLISCESQPFSDAEVENQKNIFNNIKKTLYTLNFYVEDNFLDSNRRLINRTQLTKEAPNILQIINRTYSVGLKSLLQTDSLNKIQVLSFKPLVCLHEKLSLCPKWIGVLETKDSSYAYMLKSSNISRSDSGLITILDVYYQLSENPFVTEQYRPLVTSQTDWYQLIRSKEIWSILQKGSDKTLVNILKNKETKVYHVGNKYLIDSTKIGYEVLSPDGTRKVLTSKGIYTVYYPDGSIKQIPQGK